MTDYEKILGLSQLDFREVRTRSAAHRTRPRTKERDGGQ